MALDDSVALIRPSDRVPGDRTPGMVREQAIATDRSWAGLVRTEAGMVSGWHHHGNYETTIFVVGGKLRMESGPGGAMILDARPGDFVFVPPGAIHRESNPAESESQVVVVRAGQGPPVVNVDGPAPASD
jgi:uncharacterized RmlC-like cupin family protein